MWSILSHSRKISTYVICKTSLFVLLHLEIICLCNATTCLMYTQSSYTNYDNLRQRKLASLCVHNGGSSEVTKQTCLVIYQNFWYLWFYVHEFPNWTLISENNSSSTVPESQEIVIILQFTAWKRLQMHKVIRWVFLFSA